MREEQALVALLASVLVKTSAQASDRFSNAVIDAIGNFLKRLQQTSPQIADAIELAKEEPLNYVRTMQDIEAMARTDGKLANTIHQAYAHAFFDSELREIVERVTRFSWNVAKASVVPEEINNLVSKLGLDRKWEVPSQSMNKRSDKQSSAFDAVLGGNFQTEKLPSATDAVLGGKKQIHSRAGELTTYEFDVVKVDAKGLVISRERRQAQCFTEDLGDGIGLEMVHIPGGSFLMGSPEDELGRFNQERSQLAVTIQPFCLSKYPVTQAQWKAVAALPQVKQYLDPDPSTFKGVNRPVESVCWYDVVEFCQRLTQKTGRQYRLPSEAQWEYACRAGTTTPFHFGETITPELANYNGKYTYGAGAKGINRQETTDVGSFSVANAFGLYDMHGLVLEWCTELWHFGYEGAPTDGSAWSDNDHHCYVPVYYALRGGSWFYYPWFCRCASRFVFNAGIRFNFCGFRVVYYASCQP